MPLKIDHKALENAREECFKKIENYEPVAGFCNLIWDEMLCWDAVSAGSVAEQACPPYVEDISKIGFAFRECGEDGMWINPDPGPNATNGWTNYSDCFKEDPEFAAIKHDITRIDLMSNIGYGISLVSLVVAVLIMCLSRRLHCKSNSLHINLFIAFIIRAVVSLLKHVLFVEGLGLEKDVVQVSHDKWEFQEAGLHWECKLIVAVFMYSVAASMMWIFMEGLYLHMLVYKTLFTERTGVRMYVIIGWRDTDGMFCFSNLRGWLGTVAVLHGFGFTSIFKSIDLVSPFLYIIPWILVRIFIDNTLCWNTDEFGFMWIIKSPIIVTIVINFVFFINIIRVLFLRMKTHRNTKGNNQQVRKLAKFSLVLIPLFGVLYIGVSAYPNGMDLKADMIYLYCEMFYNSFQGFLLAVLFCFLNEEVHNEVRRCWYRHRHSDNLFTRTFTLTTNRKGSCLSHTCNAQAIQKSTNKLQTGKRLKGNIDGSSEKRIRTKDTAMKCLNGSAESSPNKEENVSDCEQIRPLMD